MGVIVSNCDRHIDSYKPADMQAYVPGNNHGSIVEINGEWYIFYHRHTNGSWFSRQGCFEKIRFNEDGTIPQVEITSCGGIDKPLIGSGEYPAYLACHLFYMDDPRRFPKITQDGRDGDQELGYITDMHDSATAGFKYFDCKGVKRVKIKVRGYCRGHFEVKTAWDGEVLGKIHVEFSNIWREYSGDIAIPDGVHALYFTFRGRGPATLASFILE